MSKDWSATTIETYDTSAEQLATYFAGIGARTDDIERAIALGGKGSESKIVEIGCGDGRDAAEIIPRCAWYQGFDPSEGLLELARQRVGEAYFVKADAQHYDYPRNVDVVFAFASLLHVNREEFGSVMHNIHGSLRTSGVAYLSLKHRAAYEAEARRDEFGDRMFYYYSLPDVVDLAGDGFKEVYHEHHIVGKTDWLKLCLQKVN